MKLAGLLLLLAGWVIVLTAIVILSKAPVRSAFVLAGAGVEVVGLGLLLRPPVRERPSHEQLAHEERG